MTLLNVKKTDEEADNPKTIESVDEFSMENLDLNALDEELLNLNNVNDSQDTTIKTDTPTDSFDFDRLNAEPLPSTDTPKTDGFDFDSLNQAVESTSQPNQTPDYPDFDLNQLNAQSTEADTTPNLAAPIATPTATSLFAKKDKPAKRSLFGKKSKSTEQLTKGKMDNKKILIVAGLFVALLVLVGVIVKQFSQINAIQNPTAAVTGAIAPTASTPENVPNDQVATTVDTATDTTAPTTEQNAESPVESDITPLAQNIIQADEILKSDIPQDDAIAKEELDRLADQAKQLKEQETLIESQLKTMNELSDKKDERIALLEEQIAQLEQQNAGGKN